MESVNLIVYGTLMRGESNSHFCRNATFISSIASGIGTNVRTSSRLRISIVRLPFANSASLQTQPAALP